MPIIPDDAVEPTTCDLYDEFGEHARVIGSDLIDFGGNQLVVDVRANAQGPKRPC